MALQYLNYSWFMCSEIFLVLLLMNTSLVKRECCNMLLGSVFINDLSHN